ncbi:MAG TPA: alpha/beta fold hydrolase, partial [Pseudonocardiaceae bacterium]|nr:alpha/beta fold hydrolase [Pseudonocardiaceae bacterium]
ALPGLVLENQYGPTETHLATAYPMTGDPQAWPSLPPIGRAIGGVRVLVLDGDLQQVPEGTPGEIYLGGVCLADGYDGRPDLTGERFLETPYGRLYRTGDLGFVLPRGDVVCTGRADAQVKVRGFRVEPAEVELALTGLPGVRETAVVARRRGGDAFLAAFCVGERTEPAQVRRRLRAVLPEYMVPSRVQWLPALPLTPSGKRDDLALQAMPLDTVTSAVPRPPADSYERAMAELIADVLELSSLGVDDNVFDLGATSLSALRVVVLAERRFGTSVPLSVFAETPTAAGLAAWLRHNHAAPAFDPLVELRRGCGRPLFLVHPIGGNVLCYVPLVRHLPGKWPVYALAAAGTATGTEPLRTVGDMAEAYLEAIRRVQPDGPYTVAGWSFGGFVAFELAARLQREGAGVENVILLDTVALDPEHLGSADREHSVGATPDAVLTWFFWELLLLGHEGGAAPSAVPPAIPPELTVAEKFEFISDHAAGLGVLPTGASAGLVRRLFEVYQANLQATGDYRPGVLDCDLTLIQSALPLPEVLWAMHDAGGSRYRDPANGWSGRTAGRLNIIQVPGDHLTMMKEPQVDAVAAALADLIGR